MDKPDVVDEYLNQKVMGLQVHRIEPGSVTERAGLHKLDVILSVDNKPIQSMMDYVRYMNERGDKVDLIVKRGNSILEFQLDYTNQV